MVRKYPERAAALGDLRAMAMTARYSAEPGGGGPGRSTEAAALRELPPTDQREYDAVRAALDQVEAMPGGGDRIRLIRLVYWERRYRLYSAARAVGISERTAKRWNSELLYTVAKKYGLA